MSQNALSLYVKGNISKCFLFFLAFIILFGCARERQDVILEEAKTHLSSLLLEIKNLNSRQEALQKKAILEKKFFDLVQSSISLRENGLILLPIEGQNGVSLQRELLAEMQRLYQIDGCQAVIESAGELALETLDRYEHGRDLRKKRKENTL